MSQVDSYQSFLRVHLGRSLQLHDLRAGVVVPDDLVAGLAREALAASTPLAQSDCMTVASAIEVQRA